MRVDGLQALHVMVSGCGFVELFAPDVRLMALTALRTGQEQVLDQGRHPWSEQGGYQGHNRGRYPVTECREDRGEEGGGP